MPVYVRASNPTEAAKFGRQMGIFVAHIDEATWIPGGHVFNPETPTLVLLRNTVAQLKLYAQPGDAATYELIADADEIL